MTLHNNKNVSKLSIPVRVLEDSSKRSDTAYTASDGVFIDERATPGETTRAGIRQVVAGAGGVESNLSRLPTSGQPLPSPEQNFSFSTKTPYLDVVANVYANVSGYASVNFDEYYRPLIDRINPDNNKKSSEDWLYENCGDVDSRWFIPGICENGHRIAKVIVCGKEWCPVCGKIGSIAHNRRYVRWLPKIMQFKRMRYLVFTIPEDLRWRYRTKEDFTELGRRAQTMLKKYGFKRGLRRWHWFGDKAPYKWHPHLNVLAEGGYISKSVLESIKKDWAKILDAKVVSVHHKYKPTPRDMAGCLHYVTRSTFLDYSWDIEMALELKGFRNMVVWGKNLWNDAPVWSLDAVEDEMIEDTGEYIDHEAIEKIVNHECPRCGGRLSWKEVLPVRLVSSVDYQSYGAGYFHKLDRHPPNCRSNDIEDRLNHLRLVRHAQTLGGIIEKW